MSTDEDRLWQRLDKWLWCARFMKARTDCARWIGDGGIRINRQPTDKPHARLRPGDVLTMPVGSAAHGRVRVVRVLALATRRGPAPEARLLYEEIGTPPAGGLSGCCAARVACAEDESSAYRPHLNGPPTPNKESL